MDKTLQWEASDLQVFKKRWLILALFCFYAICNTIHYIQYSVVADVVVMYYNVSYTAVDWSSMISAVTYIVFSFPGGFIVDKLGLRYTVLIGIIGTTIGAWIKVLSVNSDRYWVVLLGQGIASIFQICILPIAPKIASVWFGANEVSTACSLGIIGTQVGFALGYILPPLLITKGDIQDIENGLYIYTLSLAIIGSIMIPVMYCLFTEKPLIPPSYAQLKVEDVHTNFKEAIKNIMTNRSFLLYIIIFSMNISVSTPYAVLSNQIILYYYPDAAKDVGLIGLLVTCVSLMGSFVSCYFLDKFHKFKEFTIATHILYLFSIILYVYTLDLGIPILYVTSLLTGFFSGCFISLGVELTVELTYPEPSNISVGILINLVQTLSIIFTFLYSYIFKSINIIWANMLTCSIILLSDILFLFMKFDLKRLKAQNLIALKEDVAL